MITNPIIFYIASFLIITFALISMFVQNLIYSLLAAIMVFFSAAIFFFMLGSEYNAIIQAAIYGLAVPIIIGLSIMFTVGKDKTSGHFTLPYLTIVAALILTLTVFTIIMIPNSFNISEIQQINSVDVMSAFANGIYKNYVWAFELLSLLLTIVIAGFTLYKKRRVIKWK